MFLHRGCREDTFMRNVEIEMAYFILKQKQKQKQKQC